MSRIRNVISNINPIFSKINESHMSNLDLIMRKLINGESVEVSRYDLSYLEEIFNEYDVASTITPLSGNMWSVKLTGSSSELKRVYPA